MPRPPDGDADPLLGGRYRVGKCIGEGGMARVHRGEDVLLGRAVAIKLIRPGIDAGGAPDRVRGEVSVLASLSHPSLVTLFDAHLDEGDADYLVMELVDGPPLSDRIDGGPLPREEVAHLAAELAEALHVVHAAGIVHRDVKPSNVLLYPSHLPGRPFRAKLADFGIARLLDDSRVTDTGQIVGTAAYLAPEQVRGHAPAPPADVYALGLVLLEALTGRRAYPHAEGIGTALARLSAPPELPVSLGPRWTSLLSRMTALDPGARPPALEVAVAAGDILAAGIAPRHAAWSRDADGPASTVTAPFPVAAAPTEPVAAPPRGTPAPSTAASQPGVQASPAPQPLAPPAVAGPAATVGSAPAAPGTTAPEAAGPLRRRERRVRRRRRTTIALAAAAVIAVIVGAWTVDALGAPGRTSLIPPMTESTPGPDPSRSGETPRPPGEEAVTVEVAVDEAPRTDDPANPHGVADIPGAGSAGLEPATRGRSGENAATPGKKAAPQAREAVGRSAEKAAERGGR